MSIDFIAIGASLGGLNALKNIFSSLPENFEIPIAVVIHRKPSEHDYICEALQQSTKMVVREAYDKAEVSIPGITIAPAGYHLLVESNHYALSIDTPIHNARPSIDVLFESVADTYRSKTAGVLLTGGGIDGVGGLCSIAAQGGRAIVQDPQTATNPELPKAAISAGLSESVFTLDEIAFELKNL